MGGGCVFVVSVSRNFLVGRGKEGQGEKGREGAGWS